MKNEQLKMGNYKFSEHTRLVFRQPCKRQPFSAQKVTFYDAKGRILRLMQIYIVKSLVKKG